MQGNYLGTTAAGPLRTARRKAADIHKLKYLDGGLFSLLSGVTGRSASESGVHE
jgi:hypothetical protein